MLTLAWMAGVAAGAIVTLLVIAALHQAAVEADMFGPSAIGGDIRKI